jgi:iron-sulfur cluster repair protein YtfE (RIC family)
MTESISKYFETDHDRLDELFKNFQSLKRTDYPEAKGFFREFKFGLQRHIVWEEEILFPLFEEKSGMTQGGPTEMMRIEHRQIGERLEAIHKKVKLADPNSDEEEKLLLAILSVHNMKEENILYPMIDRAATDADRTAVFEKMESLPEERYAQCCHHAV